MEKTYREIAEKIAASERILVFTGAGISTSCGLPDFRGENGLFEIARREFGLPYPEAVFDLDYFRRDPVPFFRISRDLVASESRPSLCHTMIARLEEAGKVFLTVTQNVDMLHHLAGSREVMECHGTYRTATCLSCRRKYSLEDIRKEMEAGEIPRCGCGGIIKPDIVFYGEELPREFYTLLVHPPAADLILILGSSLNTRPAADFALDYAGRIPSVLVNRDPTPYDDMMTWSLHDDLDEFARRLMEDRSLFPSGAGLF